MSGPDFENENGTDTMDLSTTYMGLNLKNPLVAAASPLSYELAGIKRLEDAGAAAVVMYSLFEEQICKEAKELFYYTTQGTESFAESLSYFPEPAHYNAGPRNTSSWSARPRSRPACRSSPASTASRAAAGSNTPQDRAGRRRRPRTQRLLGPDPHGRDRGRA